MKGLFPVPTPRGPVDEGQLWKGLYGRRCLIVGFTARTGLSAARLFREHGVNLAISDRRPLDEWKDLLDGFETPSLRLYGGPQDASQLDGIDFILLSPGVPRSIPLIRGAVELGIPVYNDVDFVFPFVSDKVVCAVTGTDGKSTVTEMLAHVLQPHGGAIACGNNGLPVLEALPRLRGVRHVVMELSSYMLEDPIHLAPDISTMTNLAGDHLDRYTDLEAYGRAKRNIVRHAAAGSLYVQNLDSAYTREFSPALKRVTISRKEKADYQFDGAAFHFPDGTHFFASACLIQGVHNQENILTVMAMAHGAGMNPRDIIPRVSTFAGLPHRLAPVPVKRKIRVFDDSKATTLQAVHRAIESFTEPVVLIAGGRGKGLDYSELLRHRGVRLTICYGEAGPDIARALVGRQTKVIRNFPAAIDEAWAAVREGEVLLLSPACTSWDQHADYSERGRAFVAEITRLDGEPQP